MKITEYIAYCVDVGNGHGRFERPGMVVTVIDGRERKRTEKKEVERRGTKITDSDHRILNEYYERNSFINLKKANFKEQKDAKSYK